MTQPNNPPDNSPVLRAAMTHELKTWPEYFAKTVSGEKTFELRKNDRDYRVGDTLRLLEYHEALGGFTGKKVECRVTYIAQGVFGLPPEVYVMSIAQPDAATLRAALDDLESICRMQGHLYFNPKGHGRRLFWTEAGWELEPHTYDAEPYTFQTVLEAFTNVKKDGELKVLAAAMGEGE